MWNRVGLLGGAAIVLALVVLFGTYQVQEKPFPDWLFVSAVFVGVLLLVGGVLAWSAAYIFMPIRSFFAARYYRWPFPRKDAPDPNQWLLDIAQADEHNPAATVRVLDRRIIRWTLDARRPFLQFGVTMFNGSVHSVVFSGVDGPITFNGEPLETPPEFEDGASRIIRGQRYELRVKQYIPLELVEEVHTQLSASVVNSFGLGSAGIEVRADVADAQPVRLTIGGNDQLAVGN